MKVRVRLDKGALLPRKAMEMDYCYDCVAVSEEEIAPNVWKYGLGLHFQIVRPTYNTNLNLSIDARPRSSVWKTGMVLSNCEGTIDEGYRGEVSAVFYHVMPDMPRYRVGDRVVQIKLGCAVPMDFEIAESLDDTERGANGYGSTGR